MTPLPNPFITAPVEFKLDVATFLHDIYGKHRLERAPPIGSDETPDITRLVEVLTRY